MYKNEGNYKTFWWENGYKNMQVSTMGSPNHDLIELSHGLPPKAKVLDLGCGEGRNSLYLASKGFDVVAVDRSESGIKKLSLLSEQAGYNITTHVSDIRNYKIDTLYHLIMAYGVIDYLENNEWRKLLTEIKKMTVPGGYNAYTCMIFNEQYPAPSEFTNSGFKFCLSQNELGEFYKDWDIIRYDYYVKWDQHPSIPIHYHPLENLISKKSGNIIKHPVIEFITIKDSSFDIIKFRKIYMGMPIKELEKVYGTPDEINSFPMEGTQFGIENSATINNYNLSLWYYGISWIYVIQDRVWGKSISLKGKPIRVIFK